YDVKPKLTTKQQAFADYYIETGNATKSALKAGYSKNYTNTNANKILQNTTVRKYIDEKMDELASKRIASATEVLEFYTSVLRSEETEEVVLASETGINKVNKKPDIKDRQRAAEELLKRYTLGDNQKLKDKLLEAQIKKVTAETKNEEKGITHITIVDEWTEDED